jgi:chemotaxis-related protein WspD
MNEQSPLNGDGGDATSSRLAMDRLLERPISSAALDENTRLAAQRHEEVEADELTILITRIGDEWLGFDARFADRVHEPAIIRRVPHRNSEHLAGVAAVDGEIVPAARLDLLLDLVRDTSPAEPRFVVVGPPDRRWAIPVDEVEGMVRVPRAMIIDPPTTISASLHRHTVGLISLDDRLAALLDSARLLDLLDRGLR